VNEVVLYLKEMTSRPEEPFGAICGVKGEGTPQLPLS